MLLKIAALVLAGVTSIYPNAGTIQNVDEQADTFCIVDDAGDVWKMSGVEDWQEGDHCAMWTAMVLKTGSMTTLLSLLDIHIDGRKI